MTLSPSATLQVYNFGCRLNHAEGEVIKARLAEAGWEDALVVHSCAVTQEAERQAKQLVRKLHRQHPDRPIIVTGCAAQIHPERFAALPGVERVLGNHEKLDAQFYRRSLEPEATQPAIWVRDIMTLKESANHLVPVKDGRARAFLEIQNGCNHRCTFCLIPFGRGPNRSVPLSHIVEQARKMVESGYAEIVLTGVDMTGYGQDLPGTPSLGETVQRLLHLVPNLRRLRLSSLDVAEIDPLLFRLLAEEPRIMPHVHLSLQAGSAMILKRMKRRHTPEQAARFCLDLRAARPDVVYGADIIAGFPTETDEMFDDSLRMVEALDLTLLHVFPFSPREGTPAARMPQLASAIRKERAQALRALGRRQLAHYLQRGCGRTEEILVESPYKGRTNHYIPVTLQAPLQPGTVYRITLSGINEDATEWLGHSPEIAQKTNDYQGENP